MDFVRALVQDADNLQKINRESITRGIVESCSVLLYLNDGQSHTEPKLTQTLHSPLMFLSETLDRYAHHDMDLHLIVRICI